MIQEAGRAAPPDAITPWRQVRLVLAAFCGAQLLDGVTTYVALSSGRFAEQNPVFGGLLDGSPGQAFLVKLFALAMICLVVLNIRLSSRLRFILFSVLTVLSVTAPLINVLRIAGLG